MEDIDADVQMIEFNRVEKTRKFQLIAKISMAVMNLIVLILYIIFVVV